MAGVDSILHKQNFSFCRLCVLKSLLSTHYSLKSHTKKNTTVIVNTYCLNVSKCCVLFICKPAFFTT